MKIRRIIVLIITILSCLELSAQKELFLKYEHSKDFKYPVFTQITLNSSLEKVELYADTLKSFKSQSMDYCQEKGIYTLKIKFANNIYKDSISYDFEVNGTETHIEIDLSFEFSVDYFSSNLKKKKEPIPKAYLKIIRYYKPKNVEISIAKVKESEEAGSLKGPFFALKNNSNDTIYGEYHPNYFWGTLSVLQQDSTWRVLGAQLDMNFAGSSPLYPDSISLATVGSFGYPKNLPSNKYKYEILYTTNKNQKRGYSLYKEDKSCIWYIGDKNFYKLIYEFEKR